jgi:hypothetical protein
MDDVQCLLWADSAGTSGGKQLHRAFPRSSRPIVTGSPSHHQGSAVLAVVVAQVVESLFVVIVITGSVLIAAGCGLFAYLVHRDRWSAAEPRELAPPRMVVRVIPERAAQTISASLGRAIEAPKPRLAYPEHHAARPQPAGCTYPQARTPQ